MGLALTGSALISFDALSLTILVTCLGAILLSVWAACDTSGLWNLLVLSLLLAFLGAIVLGVGNLFVWYLAWELLIFVVWGFGRWSGASAQTMMGALPLQGFGALGSLAMFIALLMLALQNHSLDIAGAAAGDEHSFALLLLVAILLKAFGLLSSSWYESRDGQRFFLAQGAVAGPALLVVGIYPFLRFFVTNMATMVEWRHATLSVTLVVAYWAMLAALGERDLYRAATYLLFGQFAAVLARLALIQPSESGLAVSTVEVYALGVVALAAGLSRVVRGNDERHLRAMGGAGRNKVGSLTLIAIGGLALSGLAPLGGFIGLAALSANHLSDNAVAVYLAFGLSALTLAVSLRLVHALFVQPAAGAPARRELSIPTIAIGGVLGVVLLATGLAPSDLLALIRLIGQ